MVKYSCTEIEKLYEEGLTMQKVADVVGCATITVKRALKMRGVQTRRGRWGGLSYSHNPDCFKEITDESAYWIGFLMADGCVVERPGNSQKVITLALGSKDRVHLEKFKEFAEAENPIYKIKEGTQCSVSLRSNILADDLAKWGVVSKKSLIAKASLSLVPNPHFWRGVIDGDGSINFRPSGYCRLSLVGSRYLCIQFLDFCKDIYPNKASVCKHANNKAFYTELSAKYYLSTLYGGDPKYYLDRKMELANLCL